MLRHWLLDLVSHDLLHEDFRWDLLCVLSTLLNHIYMLIDFRDLLLASVALLHSEVLASQEVLHRPVSNLLDSLVEVQDFHHKASPAVLQEVFNHQQALLLQDKDPQAVIVEADEVMVKVIESKTIYLVESPIGIVKKSGLQGLLGDEKLRIPNMGYIGALEGVNGCHIPQSKSVA